MKSFFIYLSVILLILKITYCTATGPCLQNISLSYEWLMHAYPDKTLEMTCKVSDFNVPIKIQSPNKTYEGICEERSRSIICKWNRTDEGLDIKMCNCSRFEVVFTIKGKLEHHLVGNWTCTYGYFNGLCDSKVEVEPVRTYKDAPTPDKDDGIEVKKTIIGSVVSVIPLCLIIAVCLYAVRKKRIQIWSTCQELIPPGRREKTNRQTSPVLPPGLVINMQAEALLNTHNLLINKEDKLLNNKADKLMDNKRINS